MQREGHPHDKEESKHRSVWKFASHDSFRQLTSECGWFEKHGAKYEKRLISPFHALQVRPESI